MTNLKMGLKQLASTCFQQAKNLTGCYNGLTNGLNKSYRHTRLGCKKLQRRLRLMSQYVERNKEMAEAELQRQKDVAKRQHDDHQSDLKWMFIAFLMMIAEDQRRELAYEYKAASRPEDFVI